jgi:dGTPase
MSGIAPYASRPEGSRGRLHDEAPCPTRTVYQRDRDRIVHCSAFRRLIAKTQVFVYHEGDQYRTRLTHSLEVAQIARTLARVLKVNEDLVEAVSLAHDLGHTPFGHAGEEALDAAMRPVGGFDHNAQSLKIVTELEHRYAAFLGLNLTWETLEGLVKHNGPLTDSEGKPAGKYAESGLPQAIRSYMRVQDLRLDSFAALEGQIAALADDIAYNNHDIDDGFRAHYLTLSQIEEVPIAGRALAAVAARYGELSESQTVYEMNRRMISAMVEDVLAETARRLTAISPRSADDIREAREPAAAFSERMAHEIGELRRFLHANLYHHPAIEEKMASAKLVVERLYAHFCKHHEDFPDLWQREAAASDPVRARRLAGDFVAGMTDRYALSVHARLFDAPAELV